MIEITCQVAILRVFYAFFCTFAHQVAYTRYVLHETWHTTLFGIYYSIEMVSIENHSHVQEIRCYVAILSVFKLFWHFCA